MEAASAATLTAEREQKATAEMKSAMEALRERTQPEEERPWRLRKPLERVVDEPDPCGEAQQLQLDLLRKENSDKLTELEQLRERMIKALRQASENHASHLRLVEERHRLVIEEHREAQRTQELEIQKLRAQLARVEGGTSTFLFPSNGRCTTREIMEEQAQRAQTAELRQLTEELSHVQLQKDEVTRRYELLLQNSRQDTEEVVKRQQYQTNALQKQLTEAQQIHRRTQEELTTYKGKLARAQEELRGLRSEADEVRSERESISERLTAAQEQIANFKEKVFRAQAEGRAAVESEKRRVDALEQRVTEVLRELDSARTNSNSESLRAQEERDASLAKMQEIEQKAQALREAMQSIQIERDQLRVQLGRLQQGLELHKQRLAAGELEISKLRAEVATGEQQRKKLLLSMEKLSLENARLMHSRDRLLESL
ncbi:unnamed protein product [Phytomonas sp. Hart1]|nr:unnamed protein product [Phytomonas sp. Hart1]|eukprot:CCW71696.1 unnamed protein product [Phytomonas sp. isolate Hart1]